MVLTLTRSSMMTGMQPDIVTSFRRAPKPEPVGARQNTEAWACARRWRSSSIRVEVCTTSNPAVQQRGRSEAEQRVTAGVALELSLRMNSASMIKD